MRVPLRLSTVKLSDPVEGINPRSVGVSDAVTAIFPRRDGFQLHVAVVETAVLFLHPGITTPC